MAEPNPTTSATNDDGNSPATGVPSDAPPARGSLTRRQAMNMMTAVAATPAITLIPTKAAARPHVDRGAWSRAIARLERAQTEYDRLKPLHSAAFDAAEA